MASAKASQNRVYLFRMQLLIFDGGSQVVRNVVDQRSQSVPLNVFLSQERKALKTLSAKNIITKAQNGLLFPPPGGKQPSVGDIDLTLAICLLRNLKSFGLNQTFNWSATPQPTDTSLEANLCRLRNVRNEVAHIATTTGIDHPTFQQKWSEIEQVLLGINKSVQNPIQNLQQIINDYKLTPLDPEEKKKLNDEIEKMQLKEKNLELEVQLLKKDQVHVEENVELIREGLSEATINVSGVSKSVSEIKEDVADIKRHVSGNREDIIEVGREVTETEKRVLQITGDITRVKNDSTEVKKGIEQVKSDLTEVKGDFAEIQDSVAVTEKYVAEIKENVADAMVVVSSVQGDIAKVKEKYAVMEKSIVEVKGEVVEVKEDIAVIEKRYVEVKGDVSEVKVDVAQAIASAEAANKKIEVIQAAGYIELELQPDEMQYVKRKQQLKDDLLTFYQQRHSTISLSPLIDEQDTPLATFYVLPQMTEVYQKPSGEEITNQLKSLSGVFKSKGKFCREIYLTADAGFGKTAMSKYLAVTWCQAHFTDEEFAENFTVDAINAMLEYEFLFLVLLRESSKYCSIDDLILNQIVKQLSSTNNMTKEFLQVILHRERCLVILDGLDEWTHPKNDCSEALQTIPHRKAREKWTILTTTRPWKLSIIGLKNSEIDKKVSLDKLTSDSAQTLKERAVSKIREVPLTTAKNEIDTLNKTIADNKLETIECVPLLLMYLVCLHCYGFSLGQSMCGLFTNICELLLSRTMRKYPEMELTYATSQSYTPDCFSTNDYCQKHFCFLNNLGRLAFEMLFSDKRENTLVFERSVADMYLTEEELKLCLRSGLLSQSKVQTLVSRRYKMSFCHKTMQEYFSSLYISCSHENESAVRKVILQKCSSFQNILDLSKVFVFISGMKAESMYSISRELMHAINADPITIEYRSTTGDRHDTAYIIKYEKPLREIQNMYISCCKEIPDKKNLKLCCQDFIFAWDCKQANYFENLKLLTKQNKNNMRSLSIDMQFVPGNSSEIMEFCGLYEAENIKKICYICVDGGLYEEEEIVRMLKVKTLQSVTIRGDDGYCSDELSQAVQNLPWLQAIDISFLQIEHNNLEELVNFVLNRKSVKQITFIALTCDTHGWGTCEGFNVDLCQHSDLRKLTLNVVPVSRLEFNVSSLEQCRVGILQNHDVVTSFLRCLPAATKLHTFECWNLETVVEMETLVEILPLLVPVENITLYGMDLGDRLLPLPPVNIKLVWLYRVQLSTGCAQGIVEQMEKLPHKVKLVMRLCTIRPELGFADVKVYARTSDNLLVTWDRPTDFRVETSGVERYVHKNIQ